MKISIYIDEEKAEKCYSKDKVEKLSLLAKKLGYVDIDGLILNLENRTKMDFTLPLEVRERYTKIIATMLGLPADARPDRISLNVAAMVDKFLSDLKLCTTISQVIISAINVIFGNIQNLAEAAIAAWEESMAIIEAHKNELGNNGCYIMLKRKYAMEIQYLFFDEGGPSIEWKNKDENLESKD